MLCLLILQNNPNDFKFSTTIPKHSENYPLKFNKLMWDSTTGIGGGVWLWNSLWGLPFWHFENFVDN